MQPSDITAAIAWRLENIPADDVEALALVLRPLAADFREDEPRVATILQDLHYPNDRRGSWSLACAVLADDAGRRGDLSLFLLAGIEAVRAMQQGRNGKKDRHPLTSIMRKFKTKYPDLTSEQAFDHFSGLEDDVIADYASWNDSLILHDAPDLSRESFCRQYRR
ncbi:MAG: hypothetical protein NTY41_18545, partial [Proteobacteria bacterium]|nr:hypothetical protein [Pseudomonadota bacterium]